MRICNNPVAIAAIALLVSCGTSGTEPGPVGNTTLNLNIVNAAGTSGEFGFSIDRVDYRVTCTGSPTGAYPIPDADTSGTDYGYDDSVDISGAFEVVDTRVPPVWQTVMDLPPRPCTITLSVYEDDEIVCVGSQTLFIVEDGTTKYDIVLVCSLSVDLPDGMADVDGTFEFITGNLCPKLYVLNAIPSTITQDTSNPDAQTEIQYRAKDPDNSCGNNCDPQTCDFSNPPVCTPYPSNINDPACNPAAGGDPNSVDCQAGVYAGLVCTIAGLPSSTPGVPGGTFISPADGVTPVGPVLPVNLNLASGVPGIILPGLGGPAGTNAANSPAYPPLPNVNGSLPALLYQCDITLPGPTLINLDCSDGDAECDQNKQLIVNCPGNNFCVSDPVDCSGSSECLTDGVCNPSCDPTNPACNRCQGQDNSAPDGTACSGGECLAGGCVECVSDAACIAVLPPEDCQLASSCVGNSCVQGTVAPAGTACSNGVCDGSGIGAVACQFVAIDPPGQSQAITVSCKDSLSGGSVWILPFQLDVHPVGAIFENHGFAAQLGGVAVFPEAFLDAAHSAIPGGLSNLNLVDLVATVQVRQGATGADVPLSSGASIPYECVLDDTGPGAQQPCDPSNDLPSVPGNRGNADCVPTSSANACGRVLAIPTSNDCDPGGLCSSLGKFSQCQSDGFCVTGSLPLPLDASDGWYVSDASGLVLFGWADNPPNPSIVGSPPISPDGTWSLFSPFYTGIAGDIGIAVSAHGLTVQLECVMGVDSGGPDGVGVPDGGSPTPDSELIAYNIQVCGGPCPSQCLDSENSGGSNPNCDSSPTDCREPSICSGDACQARGDSPDGTPCSTGVCEAGLCTGCLDGENSGGANPGCPSPAVDCLEPSICSGNICQPRTTSPDGTPCSTGLCDAGVCLGCLDSENSGGSNPSCDDTAIDCLEPSICSGSICQPRATSPDGTPCTTGSCQGGLCLGCLDSENSGGSNPNCDSTPVDCLDPSICSGNLCQPRATSPDGTACSAGICQGGACGFAPCDPCSGACGLPSCTQFVSVTCSNSITADFSILPYYLTVDPTPVIANQPFTAALGGIAEFDEVFLDAAQGAIPGGVTKAFVVDLISTVQTRGAGATGPDVPLTWGSGVPYECVLGDTGPGVQEPCDPTNDLPSIPGVRGNTDCVPTGSFNQCLRRVELPLSYDCLSGGVCELRGKAAQCTANGFCVTGGVPLPLDPAMGSYVAGDGVSPGQTTAMFGWFDDPADASPSIAFPPIDPDGTWNRVQPAYTGVSGPVGLAVNAGGLSVQLECVMGVHSGGPDGVGVGNDTSPTPDYRLIQFPVQIP